MRVDLRLVALVLAIGSARADAQGAAEGPVLGAHALRPGAALKVWVEDGRVRLVAWDRDSIIVRGHVGRGEGFFIGGDSNGMKFGTEKRPSRGVAGHSDIVAYIPRRSPVSVKTVSATIDAAGVSGWFYSVSGTIHLSGRATSVEAESMNGSLDLDVTTPWLRARTGDGHLLLRGAAEDVDVSTISGTLDIAATTVRRGLFGSVSGDIHYAGSPLEGGIVEFSNHSGNVELLLPRSVSGVFALTSIVGSIENGFARAQPIVASPRSLRVSLGRGGSQVTVRTFRGAIRLRAQ
jgi:hypothetical protein